MSTSRLTPELIPLDKGLNLQAAKIVAPPGSVLDSLNYEQVDFLGQKRIDGYVRYDGSLGSYQDYLYEVVFNENISGLIDTGTILMNKYNMLVGVVVHTLGSDSVIVALINQNLPPRSGDLLNNYEVLAATNINERANYDEQYALILESNTNLRSRVTSLPGPVAGLHWFGDRLYAVASVPKVYVGGGNEYMPNDLYELPSGDMVPILRVDGPHVYLGTTNIQQLEINPSDLASLFQSRSEQQALDELGNQYNYGWEFVHQGWNVPFIEGISLYGSLPALTLNRQNVEAASPTNIDAGNGRPLSVIQNIDITGMVPQVNGWKDSTSPTSYNINADAIGYTDDHYLYADAYISWNADGTITQNTETLESRPANATVEVHI